MSLTIITNNTDNTDKEIKEIKETEKTEIWGQFADIEEGYVFQEHNVKFFSKPIIKPKPNQIPKPFQKQVEKLVPMKKPFEKLVSMENPIPMQKIETDINDDYNPALNKIIERQIYLGCLICILTIGLFIMP
jgi:hypothetical protein